MYCLHIINSYKKFKFIFKRFNFENLFKITKRKEKKKFVFLNQYIAVLKFTNNIFIKEIDIKQK